MRKTNEKGITLIVLVITIIIMMILTGVTLDVVIDRKLLDGAEETVNRVEQHENTMGGIREEVRNQIRPSDT